MTRIYLDHASTTPVIAEAKSAFAEALECWSNPNSPHSEGRECRAKLEAAREEIKQVLGWRNDLIFTSGASEAVEIVGRRARVDGRAHGAVEHAIVPFAMGERSAAIAVDASGLIDEDALDEVLARGGSRTALESFVAFRGRAPPIDALLRHNGMTLSS